MDIHKSTVLQKAVPVKPLHNPAAGEAFQNDPRSQSVARGLCSVLVWALRMKSNTKTYYKLQSCLRPVKRYCVRNEMILAWEVAQGVCPFHYFYFPNNHRPGKAR